MSVEADLFDLKAEVLANAVRRRRPQGGIDKNAILDQLRSGTSMEDIYGVLIPPQDKPEGIPNPDNEKKTATDNSKADLLTQPDFLTRFRHFVQWLTGR